MLFARSLPGTELPNRNVRFDGEFRRISRHAADGAGRPSETHTGSRAKMA